MKNKLGDLNNYLFETLERLSDDELMKEDGEKEIERAKAISGVAREVVNNSSLAFRIIQHAEEYGYTDKDRKKLMIE